MNRRSILSTLCTGALALLAPVVAYAKPRRWVGFHNRGVKPMVILPREDLTPEQLAEFKQLWESDVQIRCLSWDSFDPRNRISTPLPDGVVAITETHLMATYQRERTLTTHNAEPRALLADARETRVGNGNPDYLRALERVAVAAYSATDADESWAGYVESQNKIDDLLEVLCDEHRAAFTAALKGHRNA